MNWKDAKMPKAAIIPFVGKKFDKDGFPVFEKIVDGEVIQCVDVDALSDFDRRRYFGRRVE